MSLRAGERDLMNQSSFPPVHAFPLLGLLDPLIYLFITGLPEVEKEIRAAEFAQNSRDWRS